MRGRPEGGAPFVLLCRKAAEESCLTSRSALREAAEGRFPRGLHYISIATWAASRVAQRAVRACLASPMTWQGTPSSAHLA